MTAVNTSLMLWAFVVGFFGGCGWAVAHWVVGKIAAIIDRA